MSDCHNGQENSFMKKNDFTQYHSLLLSGQKGNTLQTNTTQVITEQLDWDTNSHVFTYITMITYIITVKCNVQIINVRKDPVKVLVLS